MEKQYGDETPSPFSFQPRAHHQRAGGLRRPLHDRRNASDHRRVALEERGVLRARFSGRGRAIARRSRTKSCASPTIRAPNLLEPEGLDDDTSIQNGISTSLPEDVQSASFAHHPGLENVVTNATPMRSNTTTSIRASCCDAREQAHRRALISPAKINGTTWLRRGCCARPDGWPQRRARSGGAGERRSRSRALKLHRVMIDDLVTRGVHRALSPVHVRARVSLKPAAPITPSTPHAEGHRTWLCGR